MPKPQFILVMRHAEKAADPTDPDLSPAGQQRAENLVSYIPATFEKLDRIFASALSRHSARPYETVKPLSKATGIPIDATIADQDYAVLASDLLTLSRYADQKILICWHHGNIPSLLQALGCATGSYPNPWDPAVFNLILKVEFVGDGVTVSKITEPF